MTSDESHLPHAIGKVARRELSAHGYTRLEHLDGASAKKLLAIHGIGPKAIRILAEHLQVEGMGFAD